MGQKREESQRRGWLTSHHNGQRYFSPTGTLGASAENSQSPPDRWKLSTYLGRSPPAWHPPAG
jgi:hypothetical protein